jgi:broad specificity phosphatase PhoE
MYRIVLLRHGESEGNASGIIQGQSDFPLSEKGQQQADALAEYWLTAGKHYDLIICSPLIRAVQTAEAIRNALGIQIVYDHNWKERTFGVLEGLSFDDVMLEKPDMDWYHPYNAIGQFGESLVDLYHRASQALQMLLRRPEGSYLVVSHGALLNMTLYAILGISPHASPKSPRFYFSNTGFAEFTYDQEGKQWRLLSFNTRNHWKKQENT